MKLYIEIFCYILCLLILPAQATPPDYCKDVENIHGNTVPNRQILISGQRNVSVLWGGRTPSRLAAAVLVLLIRHGLNYTGVHLRRGPEDVCGLAGLPWYDKGDWTDFIVDMSAAWKSLSSCKAIDDCKGFYCKFCGERLELLGPGVTPTALRILAHLSSGSKNCPLDDLWLLNTTIIEQCNFLQASDLDSTKYRNVKKNCVNQDFCIVIFHLVEWTESVDELSERLKHYSLPFIMVPLEEDSKPRKEMLELIDNDISFLFLDYEFWSLTPGVSFVPPPPCIPKKKCPIAFDDTASIAIADSGVFKIFAPDIFLTIRDYALETVDVYNLVRKEAELKDTLQAACFWVLENKDKFKNKIKSLKPTPCRRIVVILVCSKEDVKHYKNVTRLRTKDVNCQLIIELQSKPIDCNDENNLIDRIKTINDDNKDDPVAGVIAAGIGAAAVSDKLPTIEIPLIPFDTLSPRVKLSASVISANGPVSHLGIAIRYFLSLHSWKRVAVICDTSWISKDFYEALFNDTNILHRKRITEYNDTEKNIQALTDANAKIFVVNTESRVAAKILCDALRLDLTSANGYVWILREWEARLVECKIGDKIKHYTLTYGFRGGNLTLPNFKMAEFRNKINEMYGNTWPMYTSSIVSALQLLGHGIKKLTEFYPQYKDNRQEKGVTRDLLKVLQNISIDGVEGPFKVNEDLGVDQYIYVDEWRGVQRTSLAIWRVKDGKVDVVKSFEKSIETNILDGTYYCYTTSNNDNFAPFCHDLTYAIAIVLLVILAPVLYKTQQIRVKKLKHNESKWMAVLLQEKDRLTSELLSHEVDINELEFQEEVSGRGTEKLAILRRNALPEQTVEVRILENETTASTTDYLREASILASLNNKNIVKFFGVCTKGSLMILTEYAYYGNLMRYLEKRSMLVELAYSGKVSKEAEHVSSAALTKMALDVASALRYLATRRIVHRDVRASKCIVDVHRCVKLSNFSMARNLNSSVDYLDKGKGAYPLVFMPRESILYGKFSPASDIWSFGVFLLELVKLGSRPYKMLTQDDIAKHVIEGKQPPIPYDASQQTRQLVQGCCQVDPDRRLTAVQVVDFLTEHTLALQPTLLQEEYIQDKAV